jgi:hypothetical protein
MVSIIFLQVRKYSEEGKRPFKCQDLDAYNISKMHASGRFGLIPSTKYFSSMREANHRPKSQSIYVKPFSILKGPIFYFVKKFTNFIEILMVQQTF